MTEPQLKRLVSLAAQKNGLVTLADVSAVLGTPVGTMPFPANTLYQAASDGDLYDQLEALCTAGMGSPNPHASNW